MDPERWQRIKELFEAVLGRPEPERSAYLRSACAGDESLRRDVESLVAGHHQAGDFMQAPALGPPATSSGPQTTPSAFTVGEVVSGRFRVVRFIGRGGMGEVYEAQDLELGTRVALKTIRPEVSSDPQMLRRFKQEIQLARRVTHPNVCRIFDLEHNPKGAGPEVSFLTMEMLEGETLANRLHRAGKMSCAEARPLIRQMADGLAAAHKVGVVHCDFKPGNVMLVGEGLASTDFDQPTEPIGPARPAPEAVNAPGAGRAVITDFGLARALRPQVTREAIEESAATGGELAGTLAYMAPEQLQGRPATPASDVYALGLVAYEMATGQQPFSGPTPLAAAYQRLSTPPPPPRSLAADLDAGLESVILQCLETMPSARYADASQALAALDGCMRPAVPSTRPVRGAPARIAAIVLGVLLLGAGGAALSSRAREAVINHLFRPAIPSRKNLVVLPFKASDAPAEDQARCDGLTETVTAQLVQVASLQVASAEFVRVKHIVDIDGARRMFGANIALSASWQHVGESARINLALIDTATGQTLRSDMVDAEVGNVFSLQDQVVLHALRMLQVPMSTGEQKDVTTHGTQVLSAYDFYVQGIGYLQRYENPHNVEMAISLLQRAISEDTNYAQPQAALAQAYLYKYNATKDPQWVEQAKAAAKAAGKLNSQLPDVQTAVGYLLQRTGDYEAALRPLRRATELDPNNVEAYQHLGQVYDLLGRSAEAEQALRSAVAVRPACWSCYNELCIFLQDHNRFGEAAQACPKVIELTPDNPWGYTNLGAVYIYLGEFERAEDISRHGLSLVPKDPNAASNAATAAFYQGRFEQDVSYSQEAIKLRPQEYSYWGNLADAYRMMPGETDKAASAYRQAIVLAKKQLEVNPKDGGALSRLAVYYARTDEPAQAQHYLAAALKISPDDWDTLEVACLVHLAAGDRRGAMKWLGLAVRAGYARALLVADPELAELRPDPEFTRLTEEAKTYR